MRGRELRWMLLGAAVWLPRLLAGQADPSAAPSSNPAQQQPGSTTSQETPGVARANSGTYAQDSSANGGAGVDVQQMKDKMFLRKAMLGGMAEVQLGQLAAQRGGSDDVKRFGERMVTEHTALNATMQPIAASMNLGAPKKLSKEDQAEYEKLNGLSGADFDKEYLTYITADHVKDLKEFHEEMDAAQDPALKDAVMHGERQIARHTRIVARLDAANGVPVPEIKQ